MQLLSIRSDCWLDHDSPKSGELRGPLIYELHAELDHIADMTLLNPVPSVPADQAMMQRNFYLDYAYHRAVNELYRGTAQLGEAAVSYELRPHRDPRYTMVEFYGVDGRYVFAVAQLRTGLLHSWARTIVRYRCRLLYHKPDFACRAKVFWVSDANKLTVNLLPAL